MNTFAYLLDLFRRPLARLCRRAAFRLSPPLTVWDIHVVVDNDLITVVVGDHLASVEMDPGEALEASHWFRHAASAATGWESLRAAGLRGPRLMDAMQAKTVVGN